MTSYWATHPIKQYSDFESQKSIFLSFFPVVNNIDLREINAILSYHGLYRLKGYVKPFVRTNIQGKKHCTLDFSIISKTILIDEDIRSIILRYILMIDFKIAGSLSEVMSKKHGPYWYKNKSIFIADESVKANSTIRYNKIIDSINKSNCEDPHPHPGVDSYHAKYGGQSDLPSWILRECMSFGFWERVFDCLNLDERTSISTNISFRLSYDSKKKKFLSPSDFISWFRSLTVLRNACAHNAIIINKNFSHNPAALDNHIPLNLPGPNVVSRLVAMKFLLRSIDESVSDRFCNELKIAITRYNQFGINEFIIKKILNIDILKAEIF